MKGLTGAEAGDLIKVKTKTQEFEGTFLPSEDDKNIILKLTSGYNIGIDKKDISEMRIIKKSQKIKNKIEHVEQDKDLPSISILHTGGTIASKVDYATGGVSAKFNPDELLELFPELKRIANIGSRLVRQMMSENMRFSHYNLLAKEVEKEVKAGAEGIIITHGTDTLHYSSAALAFILENVPVPVILVGAQRSSDRGSSDAAMNLICAAKFMTKTDFKGVAVCMHKNMDDDTCLILPATKSRKMHTSQRDAFRPINTRPIAEVNYIEDKVTFIRRPKQGKEGKFRLRPFKEDLKVGLMKIHTNMYSEQFRAYKDFDGLVIEGTALGQLPNSVVDEDTEESEKIISEIRKLTKKMPVVMASQSIYGRVDMNVYAEGRINLEAGILGNYSNMTPETTFIKLAWLLSNYKKEDIPELITKDFRGEISERIEKDTFLI